MTSRSQHNRTELDTDKMKTLKQTMLEPHMINICNQAVESLQKEATIAGGTWSKAELEAPFKAAFPEILATIIEHEEYRDMWETIAWLADVLEYNMPTGSQWRGLCVLNTVSHFLGGNMDRETQRKAAVLGWCVEILHKAHLLKTDMIEERTTSEGQQSWHLARNLGPIAFNDAILLNGAMYLLLQQHLGDHPHYARLLNLTHEAQLHKSFGYSLKSKTKALGWQGLRHLNLQRYETIVKYETGFFSFYFPVVAGLTLCGWEGDTDILQTILCDIALLAEMIRDQKQAQSSDMVERTLNWHVFAALQKGLSVEECQILERCVNSDKDMDKATLQLAADIYERLQLDNELSQAIVDLYVKICKELKAQLAVGGGGGSRFPAGIVVGILQSVFPSVLA